MYINNTCLENPLVCANENWFYNYFKNYSDISPSLYQKFVINCPNKIGINAQSVNTYKKYKVFCNTNQVLYFNRQSFEILKKKFYATKLRELIAKYLKPLPHIENMLSNIKKSIFPQDDENTIYFGAYRGTDKISEGKTNEGNPEGFNYETFYNIISRKCSEVQLKMMANIFI